MYISTYTDYYYLLIDFHTIKKKKNVELTITILPTNSSTYHYA